MKQMRSRFRLITLLLVCGFLLTLALCGGSIIKTTGFTLPSLPSLPLISGTVTPDPSASPAGDATPAPSVSPLPGSSSPAPDNSPVPEYNVFGL